jgi:nucleoside-diphosphate-sugar epimerase
VDKAKLWVTGATGFVGGHFVYRVLKQSDARIVAVVRARAGEDARERLLRTLEEVAASYREAFDRELLAARLEVVHGDITLPACGVRALDAGVDQFWHIAASLKFEDKHKAEIRLQNVDGTRNALQLAEQLGAERFVYVSTAYTCGKYSGEVPEALHDLERKFNNVYEQTKCEAEHEVARWAARSGRAATILRPSIVVGPGRSHLPGGSDTGLYGFAREIHRLRRTFTAAGRPLVMCGEAEASVNLIAVDDVVGEMWRLAQRGFQGGLVHHLTSEQHPNVGRLLEVVGRLCGVGAIACVPTREAAPSPVEQVIDRRAVFYSSYLRDDKRFARRSSTAARVTDDDLEHYVREYLRTLRSETADSLFERATVRAADGQALVAYRVGSTNAPTLLLCSAYGVAADVWVPLANALRSEFQLITWELRTGEAPELLADGPDLHASDMRSVLNHFGVGAAFVVGWCTGADVALRFAERYPGRVLGAVGVSGALNGAHAAETGFQRNLRKLVRQAAGDRRQAELYHRLLFGARVTHFTALTAHEAGAERELLSSLLAALDPALLHLTSAPFRDAEALHRYARIMQQHYAHAASQGLPRAATSVLLIACERDEVAHPDASRAAARALPDARVLRLPDADHFAVFCDARVPAAIREFVLGSDARAQRVVAA